MKMKKRLLGILLGLMLVLGMMPKMMPGMTITANAAGTTYKILNVGGGISSVIAESVTLPYATTVNAFRDDWHQENWHIKSVPTCKSGTESVVTVGAQSGTLGQSGCDFALTINNAGSEELSFKALWDGNEYSQHIRLTVIANTNHEGTTNGCGWKYTYATKTLDILSGTPASLFETYDDYLLKYLEITTINIADSVTGIGDEAFDSSNGLTSVNISADGSITSIGQWAFSNCSRLTSITIPAGVTSIADNAFNNCPNIADVYCYAAPSTLNWTTSNIYKNFKQNKATVCHVKQSDLEEWEAKENLNLKFVGDLLKSNPVAIAPTATATYGQTLADVTLTNPTGNTEGTWAWVDATTTVGTVGEHTFKANFTPTDSTNYNSVSNVDVTVTVGKANAVAATVTANSRTYDGTEKPLVTAGEATGGEMQYALGTATEATQPYTTSIPKATNVGTYYVWYKVAGDDNHTDIEGPEPVAVTIIDPTAENDNYAFVPDGTKDDEVSTAKDPTYQWRKNSSDSLLFVIKSVSNDDQTFGKFNGGVWVDGNVVDRKYITADTGSLRLTLKPEYLNTLSVGEHTLTVQFNDGIVTHKFTIMPASTGSASPGTGEAGMTIALLCLLLFLSAAGAAYAVFRHKKGVA